jgi:cytochrome c biogenesis protein CcmG, thiol:disulfide interchange protein DsbE
MRRYAVAGVITAVVVALLVVLAVAVAGNKNSLDAQVAAGKLPVAPAASMALPVLGGKSTRSLASFRGKVVLVNMFASWCPPCQAEAPVLRQAQQMLAAHNGTVLGITYQDDPTNDISFVHKYGVDYPVLRDPTSDFAHAYGVSQIPDSFVITRSGKVQALDRAQITSGWVNRTLPKILSGHT